MLIRLVWSREKGLTGGGGIMTRMQSSKQISAALQSPDFYYTRNENNYLFLFFFVFAS
jgi:hypothetical protein